MATIPVYDAPVLSSPAFSHALRQLERGEDGEAMASFEALQAQYASDAHSFAELSRWKSIALERLGRFHEAVQELLNIGGYLCNSSDNISEHHNQVVRLLQQAGDLRSLCAYCECMITYSGDSLSHLDWVVVYLIEGCTTAPPPHVSIIVQDSESLLGVPSAGDLVQPTLVLRATECLRLRDEGNARYSNFFHQVMLLRGEGAGPEALEGELSEYLAREPILLYRELAQTLLASFE